jgi:Bacterial SH3 domain
MNTLASVRRHPGALTLALVATLGLHATAGAQVAPASAQRWVNGSSVNLRSAPSLQSGIVARLALNERVTLIARADGGTFCEVLRKAADGSEASGFTACAFLSPEATDVNRLSARYLADGQPSPDYDPKRLFWLSPSWPALEAYGQWLSARRLALQPVDMPYEERQRPLRAGDEELDRMKAHVAKGLSGTPPPPYAAWQALRRDAQALSAGPAAAAPERRFELASNLRGVLGLGGPLFDGISGPDDGPLRAAALVQAIALPPVRASVFASERDVALAESTEALGARLGIVYRYRTHARSTDPSRGHVGLADIGAYTVSLVEPITRTTLLRDGRLVRTATHAAQRREVWDSEEPPMCHDHVPGFRFGDSLPRMWADDVGDYSESLRRNPKGSLLSLMTRQPLAETAAQPVVQNVRLDRAATGFAGATQWTFDLDADGVPDLVAWEGVGSGPGHLAGPTATDDPWHRLFFVNLAGRWHLLGYDVFSYGCGC